MLWNTRVLYIEEVAAAKSSQLNNQLAISNVSANLVDIACFARLVFCRPPTKR